MKGVEIVKVDEFKCLGSTFQIDRADETRRKETEEDLGDSWM